MTANLSTKTLDRSRMASAWLMWALGASFYFYEFMLQVSTSVMVPHLMRTFDISAQVLGYLSATYFFMYAPMQIPVGVLLDRYGPRKLLIMATSFCAIGSFIFGSAQAYYVAVFARAIFGFGSAFAIVGCMKLIANWFPMQRFALMLGLVLTIGMLGAVSGQAPMALLVGTLGWRMTMHFLAIVGVVIVTIMFFALRDCPASMQKNSKPKRQQNWADLFEGLKKIVKNKQTWLTSIYGSLMFAPTLAFAGLWGPHFLEQAHNFNRATAAASTSLIFIGWAVGSPLIGWASDFIGRRKTTMYIGSFGAFLIISTVLFVPKLSLLQMQILLFGFGLFSSGFLMAFPLVQEINPPECNATAMGFINSLNSLGGALLQPLVGLILDEYWSGKLANGAPVYSASDYQMALSVLPISILIALAILPLIKETYCRPCFKQV